MSSLYGFKTLNDDLAAQIDSDHVTLAVLRRGKFVTLLPDSVSKPDQYHGVRPVVTYSTPITSQSPPIVAFVPRAATNGHWHAFMHTGSPGNWTGFQVSYLEFFPGERLYDAYHWEHRMDSLSNWDFAAADSEGCAYSPEQYGMRVWTETGQLAFDSGTTVMKILGEVLGWSGFSTYPQIRNYRGAWPYSMTENYGFIASNLPMQEINTSYSPAVSPRFGFTAAGAAAGQIIASVAGADRMSDSGLYAMIDSNVMDDDTLPRWLELNPISLIAVRLT